MPWLKAEFRDTANADGRFEREATVSSPFNLRLLGYRVRTMAACQSRSHPTTIRIERVGDANDVVRVGPVHGQQRVLVQTGQQLSLESLHLAPDLGLFSPFYYKDRRTECLITQRSPSCTKFEKTLCTQFFFAMA